MTLRFIASSRLPTPWAVFTMHGFEDSETGKEHLALTLGELDNAEPVLARIHSECLTGDALFSLRCDCGFQLQEALKRIASEGRGIGLLNKIRAYHLQDGGADTVEANEQLGFAADQRDYSMLPSMLEHLGITSVRLMTNNPRKVDAFTSYGIKVAERIPLTTGLNPHNADYLDTKASKLGHLMKAEDFN